MVFEYIIPATILASSIAMLYTSVKMSYGESESKDVLEVGSGTSYRMMVKELELRREVVRNAILNIYKQYEEGKLPENVKNILINKFEKELDDIEARLSKLKEYAELERLKEEYDRLLRDFENRKRDLERKIGELEKRLRYKSREETKKEEKEVEEKKQKKEEDTLEDILREVSKIIEEYGVE